MKRFLGLQSTSMTVRVILVVTADSVCWYRCENAHITDRLKHSIDQAPREILDSCAWLQDYISQSDASIQLIIDTQLDDLDRVKLVDTSPWVSRAWHRHKVLWQLRREYSDAIVNRLPQSFYPEIASVLYSELDAVSSEWIKKLCDCEIVVTHVITSTQLLLDLFSEHPTPVLTYQFDGQSRHRLLLSVKGLPLHMRQVINSPAAGSSAEATASLLVSGDNLSIYSEQNTFAEQYLCDSLQQLSAAVFTSLDAVLIVLPRDSSGAESTEFPDEYLALHWLGIQQAVGFQQLSMSNANDLGKPEISFADFDNAYVSTILDDQTITKKNIKAKNQRGKINCKKYKITRASPHLRELLSRSISVINEKTQRYFFQIGTYGVCLTFAVLLIASSLTVIRSEKEKVSYAEESKSLQDKIRTFRKQALTLHDSPTFAMDSLIRIQLFEELESPTPLQIMSTVAASVNRFPSVSVTGFAWSVASEEFDSEYVSINSVSIRDNYWGDDTSQSKTTVEMTGQLVSETGLRDKQSQLNSFVDVISQAKNIEDMRVVDSPADSASSSHLLSESGDDFKIRFTVKPI